MDWFETWGRWSFTKRATFKKDLDKLQKSSKIQTKEVPKSNGLLSGAMYKGYASAQYKKIQEWNLTSWRNPRKPSKNYYGSISFHHIITLKIDEKFNKKDLKFSKNYAISGTILKLYRSEIQIWCQSHYFVAKRLQERN